MRKIEFIGVIIFVSMILVSCGSSQSSNEILGKFPAITNEYQQKIEKSETLLKECTDMNKAVKLDKELNLLKEEYKTEIQEYLKSNPLKGKEIPVVSIKNLPYSISTVVINLVQSGNLNIKFLIKINEDIKNKYGGIEDNLFIYYKGIDSEGKEIPGTKTVATNFTHTKLKSGANYEAFGSWQTSAIANLGNFAKIQQISKEEYEKK